MMPRIDAGERLAAITDAAIAAGNYEKQVSRRIVSRLERAAQGGRRAKVAKAQPDALAAMGVGVVIEPSKAAKPGLSDG